MLKVGMEIYYLYLQEKVDEELDDLDAMCIQDMLSLSDSKYHPYHLIVNDVKTSLF